MYFTPCSSVSIVNFEHVIAGWVTVTSVIVPPKLFLTHGEPTFCFYPPEKAFQQVYKWSSEPLLLKCFTCQVNNFKRFAFMRLHEFYIFLATSLSNSYQFKGKLCTIYT